MDRGQLVSRRVGIEADCGADLRSPTQKAGFILDGFPRNVAQAETLAGMLDRAGLKLDKVVAVIVPDEEIVKRISGRRTCKKLRRDVSRLVRAAEENPAYATSAAANFISARTMLRAPCASGSKFYAEATRPLLDHYGRLGMLSKVDGVGRTDDVEKRILSAVGETGSPKGPS